jgi:hypothetical protein
VRDARAWQGRATATTHPPGLMGPNHNRANTIQQFSANEKGRNRFLTIEPKKVRLSGRRFRDVKT